MQLDRERQKAEHERDGTIAVRQEAGERLLEVFVSQDAPTACQGSLRPRAIQPARTLIPMATTEPSVDADEAGHVRRRGRPSWGDQAGET